MNPGRRPVVLCILDGWGLRDNASDNAITQARTPVYDDLITRYPHGILQASAEDVGLPRDQFGNSEVGHINIGAGRVVLQDLPRIEAAINNSELDKNPAIEDCLSKLSQSRGTCHIIGLISPGGVHGHQSHVAALARIIAGAGVSVRIHGILDGRDVAPISARQDMQVFLDDIADQSGIDIATISGRYYALDRDKNWDRVARCYHALVSANGKHAVDPLAAIDASYSLSVTDEFVIPTVIGDYQGIQDGDGLLIANFRADRVRQLTVALVDREFDDFPRRRVPKFAAAVGMTEYSRRLNRFLNTVFPPMTLDNGLGETIAKHRLRQLRIAETEKYAHVTYFFNGGQDIEFNGEERLLIPSPRVQTYDMQPEMSALKLTECLTQAIKGGGYDFVVVNYANPDMVGHTGILSAAIQAVETVDTCLGRLRCAVADVGGVLLVTADHGNAEIMRDPQTGQPHTSHSLNPVPTILVNGPAGVMLGNGRLADIAPTVLALLAIEQPKEMTGHSLLRDIG